MTLLRERGVKVVDLLGWRKIDKVELDKGKSHPTLERPRVKLTSVDEMLEAALS